MNAEEKFFTEIGESLKVAELSQVFGKPCFKINGKAFAVFCESTVVFKLMDKTHEMALWLKGIGLNLDPCGKKRSMKE